MSNKPFDTKERTAKRAENSAKRLDDLRLYSLSEIEPIIGVTHRTLQTYVLTGKLKASKIAGKWRVTEENLRDFLNGSSK